MKRSTKQKKINQKLYKQKSTKKALAERWLRKFYLFFLFRFFHTVWSLVLWAQCAIGCCKCWLLKYVWLNWFFLEQQSVYYKSNYLKIYFIFFTNSLRWSLKIYFTRYTILFGQEATDLTEIGSLTWLFWIYFFLLTLVFILQWLSLH